MSFETSHLSVLNELLQIFLTQRMSKDNAHKDKSSPGIVNMFESKLRGANHANSHGDRVRRQSDKKAEEPGLYTHYSDDDESGADRKT